MTMSDRPGQHPTDGRATRTRWRRRLTGLTLLVAGATALIPAQGALAGDGFQPPLARAETAIKAAYAQAFTGGQDPAHSLAAVEDGPALAGTLAQAMQNFPEATHTAQVAVSGITFKGLLNAKLRFHITYQGGADFGEQDGTAVVVNRQWKVSRETFCTVMGWAGAVCPPKAGHQPQNPAAAQRAIQQAYAQAFTGGQDPAHSLAAVQDGPALADTLAQAMQNFPEATATAAVTTSDIVFTDPRNAWLRFHITYQGGLDFGVQSGTAVLVDGHWKVSRQTFCTVMGWAGATCPAP
ncbi:MULTISPECIES: hypothetical protein [unclassified Pseudofrankia]|uniref:hypothetical protein n=1 Tax=unclassified Pseudofrankia TaxID=2994372 RepID=UPI0008D9967F|nr:MULTISPECIES: hypothetical protein [unclassified Pseudofrankia]MDT3443615.1 hypothetical protein [Pseudofrankia sp. BMG5.37]OHV43928.1 hypothetical protein BCD48_26375 [Pseudofrankia sp. BMG5.36]